MKILVRLPNWLGDMVMSVGAVQQLPHFFPGCTVSVIAKKGLHDLLDYFPPLQHRFVFSKDNHPGLRGLWRFGKEVRRQERFDLFISFPDSFSAALMGYATGAQRRVGYRNEARQWLLTQAYTKPRGLHRVEEYVHLLQAVAGRAPEPVQVKLRHAVKTADYTVVNINSEAASRRLPEAKAVEILTALRQQLAGSIVLIGGRSEQPFVDRVLASLPNRQGIESVAGHTSLHQLVTVLAGARLVLTTDSGPAHLANALGTPTVVLFGAGNENNTGPYHRQNGQVLRLGKLSCEPCTKNHCVQFGVPQCLELLETQRIVDALLAKLQPHA